MSIIPLLMKVHYDFLVPGNRDFYSRTFNMNCKTLLEEIISLQLYLI